MKKILEPAQHIISSILLGLLVVALAVNTVTACGSVTPQQQPTAVATKTFWVPRPQGSDDCPDASGPGFVPPAEAKSCDIYDEAKVFLGSIKIKGGQFHCSVPNGYVRCEDAQGQRMRPDMTRAMCPFDGPEPSCTELAPSGLPNLLLAPSPPDPTQP